MSRVTKIGTDRFCSRAEHPLIRRKGQLSLSTTVMFNIPRTCRATISRSVSTRQLHATAITAMPRVSQSTIARLPVAAEDLAETVEEIPVVEQLWIEQQRRLLYYMRLIEHELPQLVGESYNSHNTTTRT